LRRTGPIDEADLAGIAAALGIALDDIEKGQWIDNGPGWCAIMLRTASQVLSLRPDPALMRAFKLGVIAPQPPGADTLFEVRAFAGPLGVAEDPVTGSLNAGLAQWLIGAGIAPDRFVVAQGAALGRRGRVFIDRLCDDIWVGGDVAICIRGEAAF
jgi:PhzF family phenazine biosynthesis protein